MYQNLNLVGTGTQTSPIVLGPCFFNWDAHISTYCDFLAMVCLAIGFNGPVDKFVFGTDEELALVNAITTVFSKSQHILCTRHLKENCK